MAVSLTVSPIVHIFICPESVSFTNNPSFQQSCIEPVTLQSHPVVSIIPSVDQNNTGLGNAGGAQRSAEVIWKSAFRLGFVAYALEFGMNFIWATKYGLGNTGGAQLSEEVGYLKIRWVFSNI